MGKEGGIVIGGRKMEQGRRGRGKERGKREGERRMERGIRKEREIGGRMKRKKGGKKGGIGEGGRNEGSRGEERDKEG